MLVCSKNKFSVWRNSVHAKQFELAVNKSNIHQAYKDSPTRKQRTETTIKDCIQIQKNLNVTFHLRGQPNRETADAAALWRNNEKILSRRLAALSTLL